MTNFKESLKTPSSYKEEVRLMRTKLRRSKILLVTAIAIGLCSANGALAWQAYDCGGYAWPTSQCPTGRVGTDRSIPSSPDSAHVSKIYINALSGLVSVPDCPIGESSANSCSEPNFNIAAYGPGCTVTSCEHGCNATVEFNDGRPSSSGDCSISDGAGNYGHGAVNVDRTGGCVSFGIKAAPDVNSKAFFIDPDNNLWKLEDTSLTAAGGQPASGSIAHGTLWRPSTLSMIVSSFDGVATHTINFVLTGDVRSTRSCFAVPRQTSTTLFPTQFKGGSAVQ